ncbi:MAG TPA: NADH-quinone oxidoreductase subunit D [Nitrososphaeraceae archaeon]|jgi:NADH-quinone oxidoreductase subunit D|nr:NADH-quinone oxidoreductase subunit D [Nitrososphaeraceae archaeon]
MPDFQQKVDETMKMGLEIVKESDEDRFMTLSVGPQHPGSGHFRFTIKLDGDYIVFCDPDPGYVHRGEEKMSEYRNFIQNIPHLERPVIHDSTNITYSYSLAVEELCSIEVPRRGQFIRAIASELNRQVYTLYWLAIYGIFLGHSTMFMWPTGDRELFIDLLEALTGARVTHAFNIPGGVRNDMPEGFKDRCLRQVAYFEKRLKEYEDIFYNNPLFRQRTEEVGILTKDDAISLGVAGSVLRASGVPLDIRKAEPYDVYNEIDFKVQYMKSGDSFARSMVPFLDMRESCHIIRQLLDKIPQAGEVRAKLQPNPKGPPGESYKRVESGRGALGYYIISDGTPRPYRVKISVGSFRNMLALPFLLVGSKLADMPSIYWSLNYWPVEADR